MKKKMMASMLTCAMMSMISIQADGSTVITTEVPSKFNLTIPTGQNIDYGTVKTTLSPLYVSGDLAQGKTVEVSVEKTAFANEKGDTISYALNEGNQAFVKDIWNDTQVGNDPKKVNLNIVIDEDTWNQAKSGKYTTTISFTAQLK